MSAGLPELGSKISLISKADIRYEGRLFTVDPQECTIALANVQSFGTEDRETQFVVAPQNQVYEYILFRGTDIKDIRVVTNNNNIPNDPAIVQMTVQPSMGQQSYQPQPGYGHPMMGQMGQMGPMGGQYGGPYGMAMGAMGPVMGMPTGARDPRVSMTKSSELSSGHPEPNIITMPNTLPTANVKPLTKDHSLEDGVLDLFTGASRSATPTASLLTRKSPTLDQGIQVGHQQQQQQQQQVQHQQSNNMMGKFGDQSGNRGIQQQQPRRGRDGSPGSGRTGRSMGQYNERKHEAMKQDGQMHDQGQMHQQGLHGPIGGRGQQQQRTPWIARGGNMRGRGRGGRGVFRNNQPGNAGAKPKNTLKFDNDYDFEQANTEFEELRSRLAKAKIDAGTENEKKDDSGNETGAGEADPEEDPDVVHYDKSKSFFDNISCEAVERSKGRSQRTDWRKERKLNSETFGVASTRRGGFRGRGYYNRGMGGMYRGGINSGNGPMGNHQNNPMNQGGPQGGGYRGGYRGHRGGANRKPHGPNPHIQNQPRNETGSQQQQQQQQPQQQQQQGASNRLVTGTA